MNRNPYKPRLFPQWVEDAIAVGGLLLIVAVLGFLAIYGYSIEQGLRP